MSSNRNRGVNAAQAGMPRQKSKSSTAVQAARRAAGVPPPPPAGRRPGRSAAADRSGSPPADLLPPKAIVIFDDDRRAANQVERWVSGTAGLGDRVTPRAFYKVSDAISFIDRAKRGAEAVEPVLAITDSAGMHGEPSFVGHMKRHFPRAPVILFSQGGDDANLLRRGARERLIDQYVLKDEGPEALGNAVEEHLREYDLNPVLASMRLYLSECEEPDLPFVDIDGRGYAMTQIYREVLGKTRLGQDMEQAWLRLVVDTMHDGDRDVDDAGKGG
jgi:hypothetical protein